MESLWEGEGSVDRARLRRDKPNADQSSCLCPGLEHFHFENALADDGASLVRANEE